MHVASWTRAEVAQRMRLLVGECGEQWVKWNPRLFNVLKEVFPAKHKRRLCHAELPVRRIQMHDGWQYPKAGGVPDLLPGSIDIFLTPELQMPWTFLGPLNIPGATEQNQIGTLGNIRHIREEGREIPKVFWGASWVVYLYPDLGGSHPPPQLLCALSSALLPNSSTLFERQLTIPSFQSWSPFPLVRIRYINITFFPVKNG